MKFGASAREAAGFLAAHADAFKAVANAQNCIVMSRAPGNYAPGLISEGYASKGFHNKAKSCNWGPMAGFVLFDPLFSKAALTKKGYDKQKKYIRNALQSGALLTPLVITDNRLTWLRRNGFIERLPKGKGDNDKKGERICRYKATLKDWRYSEKKLSGDLKQLEKSSKCEFTLREAFDNDTIVWRVGYKKTSGQKFAMPVEALVDPTHQGSIPGYHKATTGDYDLFAVWGPQTGPMRNPMRNNPNAYLRPVGPESLNDPLDLDLKEDPDKGNISPYILSICNGLNRAISRNRFGKARFRYRGGDMVHHSDEAGRPFINDIDLPFIAYFPKPAVRAIPLVKDNPIVTIETVKEFAQLIDAAEKAGYNIELNPGWLKELGPGPSNNYRDFVIKAEDDGGL